MCPSADQPTICPEVPLKECSAVICGAAAGDGLGVSEGVGRGAVVTATALATPIFTPGAVLASAATVTWYCVLGASSPEAGWMESVLPCQL